MLVTVAAAEAELAPVLEADPALAVELPCRLLTPATWALIWAPAQKVLRARHRGGLVSMAQDEQGGCGVGQGGAGAGDALSHHVRGGFPSNSTNA